MSETVRANAAGGGHEHPWREDLGAYVVGALRADEAEQMRSHLEQCASCRAEHAELEAVTGLLARVPVEALDAGAGPAVAPDPAMWERLRARAGLAEAATATPPVRSRAADRAHRPRRARRPLRPTAAAALSGALVAAAAFGVYAGVHDDGSGSGPGTVAGTETVSAANAADGVSGTVRYHPTDWGSSVQITVKGVKPGDDCVLYATDHRGNKSVASTWWAPYPPGESATIPGGVAMQSSDIANFQVTTTMGEVLLTIPAS